MVVFQCAGDLLLQNKEHAELLQTYNERRDAAVRFIHAVRPGLEVQTAALKDPKVHSDGTLGWHCCVRHPNMSVIFWATCMVHSCVM